MSHVIQKAGGVFSLFHNELCGEPIDFSAFDPKSFSEELFIEACGTWQHRVHTEFRSTQVMGRFLMEVLGAGDPIDIYAGAVDLVADEVKHTDLCRQVCAALGFEAKFPEPPELTYPDEYLKAPMSERALATALSMVTINETLSVGFLMDLAERCKEPGISDVLQATAGDEEGHQEFGWSYIQQSMKRFPESTMPYWRGIVQQTLDIHFNAVNPILASMADDEKVLELWPDAERVRLGLFSRERQALVFQKTYKESLAPRLEKLELLPSQGEVRFT